jgi:ABC-type lipoprotein release transport system permease subunit
MRVLTNTISSLIQFWSVAYVSALLSIYTFIAGILARNRAAAKTPAKPIRSKSQVRILMQPQPQSTN